MKPFVLRIRVRYAETDQMGVVHHRNYFTYFEQARIEMLRAWGMSYADLEKSGVVFAIARVSCALHGAARYDEELEIRAWVKRFTHTRIDHEYEVLRLPERARIAQGESTLVCLDHEGRQQAIPDEVMNLLESAMETRT